MFIAVTFVISKKKGNIPLIFENCYLNQQKTVAYIIDKQVKF